MSRFILFLILTVGSVQLFAFDNNDVQLWNFTGFEKSRGNITYYVNEETDWGRNVSDFYMHRTEGGVIYKVNSNFSFSMNYKQVNLQSGENWSSYNVPHTNFILSIDLGSFEIASRNRFEYWTSGEITDFGRYRNRIKVDQIWLESFLPLSAYIAEEFFVDFNEDQFKRTRTYVGIEFGLFANLEIGFFYCFQQSIAKDGWKNLQVLGSDIKFVY